LHRPSRAQQHSPAPRPQPGPGPGKPDAPLTRLGLFWPNSLTAVHLPIAASDGGALISLDQKPPSACTSETLTSIYVLCFFSSPPFSLAQPRHWEQRRRSPVAVRSHPRWSSSQRFPFLLSFSVTFPSLLSHRSLPERHCGESSRATGHGGRRREVMAPPRAPSSACALAQG
jgi:hypothetical protein